MIARCKGERGTLDWNLIQIQTLHLARDTWMNLGKWLLSSLKSGDANLHHEGFCWKITNYVESNWHLQMGDIFPAFLPEGQTFFRPPRNSTCPPLAFYLHAPGPLLTWLTYRNLAEHTDCPLEPACLHRCLWKHSANGLTAQCPRRG